MTEREQPGRREQAVEITPESTDEAMRRVESIIGDMMKTGRVSAAFGEPRQVGDYTIIPVARVGSGGGVGFGYGEGSSPTDSDQTKAQKGSGGGGGGGGGAMANPVAVVVVTPEEVKVQPVIDFTQVLLAALGAMAFNFFWFTRLMGSIRAADRGGIMKDASPGAVRKLFKF